MTTRIAILNSMAGSDFEAALDRHVAWGLTDLDLKDAIYGKSVADLSYDDILRAKAAIEMRKLRVHCLSSHLFGDDIALGEQHFRDHALDRVPHLLRTAQVLGASRIRLLAPQYCAADGEGGAAQFHDRARAAMRDAPWLVPLFLLAIDDIQNAGFYTVIENETGSCIIASPEDALAFFAEIDWLEAAAFTWDIQNMWQLGVFPTVETYERLIPIIGYVHVKGGLAESPGGPLVWRSSLAGASWPVREIVTQVVRDRVSPVICINPSHGESPGGVYEDYTRADIDFLRQIIEEADR